MKKDFPGFMYERGCESLRRTLFKKFLVKTIVMGRR